MSEKVAYPHARTVLEKYPELLEMRENGNYFDYIAELQKKTLELHEVLKDEYARSNKGIKSIGFEWEDY